MRQLRLPSSLQHLDFQGCTLFVPQGKHYLANLMQLTSVSLSPAKCNHFREAFHIPVLPRSVQHLQLSYMPGLEHRFMFSLDSDFEFLASLAGLKHLTLPGVARMAGWPHAHQLFACSDKLQALIRAAPQVTVVDFVGRPHGWHKREVQDLVGSIASMDDVNMSIVPAKFKSLDRLPALQLPM